MEKELHARSYKHTAPLAAHAAMSNNEAQFKKFCKEWEKLWHPAGNPVSPTMLQANVTADELNKFAEKWELVLKSVNFATIPKAIKNPKKISQHPLCLAGMIQIAYDVAQKRLAKMERAQQKEKTKAEAANGDAPAKKKATGEQEKKKRKKPEEAQKSKKQKKAAAAE